MTGAPSGPPEDTPEDAHAAARRAVADPARLAAVHATGLLDTEVEEVFDRLTRLAVRLVGVPAAFLSLVDAERDFYKSAHGFGEPLASARELAGPTFCHYAVRSAAPLVIPDTAADPVYQTVPTVHTLGVAAYVGVPLVVLGEPVGSFCAIDTRPRAWTPDELEVLTELAASAQREIELRAALRAAERERERLAEARADVRQGAEERGHLVTALQVERARLAEVFRRAPAFLAILRGPAHVFEFVNDAYARLVGFRDVVGQPVFEALPEVRGQGFEALLDGVYRTGVPYVGRETPILVSSTPGAAPEPRVLDFVYQPLREADGEGTEHIVGVVAHGVDVTEQVRARREIEGLLADAQAARAEAEAARLAAEDSARVKAEFLATMSHEIRTPINAIVGYTQLLELGIPDPVTAAQQTQLARVTGSARHLLGLVNDVLDVAKLDAGEVAVTREHATAAPAVGAALALVRPLADERGVRLADGVDDVTFVGDEARVRQVLVNLLSNAVKFTPAGGTVRVRTGVAEQAPPSVRVAGSGPWAFVAVRDTGVGIASDQQALVFEPFVQAAPGQTPYTRTQGGTGLGLTISRRLARLMGGDLTLESTPGAGSTFTLWLPAAAAATAAGGAAETADARGARAGLPGTGWRVHGLAEIGRALRESMDGILEAYTSALRSDPAAPRAASMPLAHIEDHAITLLADLAQSLVILDGAGEDAGALMRDGTTIQRTVAEAHGARRAAQGWDEAALRRDHVVMRETVARVVRARVASHAGDVSEGLRVLHQLQVHVEAASVAAFRQAREGEAAGG